MVIWPPDTSNLNESSTVLARWRTFAFCSEFTVWPDHWPPYSRSGDRCIDQGLGGLGGGFHGIPLS